jgi:hypothetical protein
MGHHLISGTELKDKKMVPKWYMVPNGNTLRVYPTSPVWLNASR